MWKLIVQMCLAKNDKCIANLQSSQERHSLVCLYSVPRGNALTFCDSGAVSVFTRSFFRLILTSVFVASNLPFRCLDFLYLPFIACGNNPHSTHIIECIHLQWEAHFLIEINNKLSTWTLLSVQTGALYLLRFHSFHNEKRIPVEGKYWWLENVC